MLKTAIAHTIENSNDYEITNNDSVDCINTTAFNAAMILVLFVELAKMVSAALISQSHVFCFALLITAQQ